MYSQEEVLWLEQYSPFALSAEQKAIILLGRKGNLVAPQDIWDRLGLVDTDHYRQLISSLQFLGILESARSKGAAQSIAKRERISLRAVPRFKIKLAKDANQPSSARSNNATSSGASRSDAHNKTASDDSEDNLTIFVGNLPENVTNRDMLAAFAPFGTVESVYVPKNGDISRGYAFVEFESAEIARKMLKEQPRVMMGPYPLSLRPARPCIGR
jgi:ATP-dependent DNA helicase RecG